nr:VOC family protein [Ponticaulis sp.]|tara:strand:- start:45604 stop:46002 length:399 start_codon:yes stop_codon:yes gene_type:complete
MGMTGVLRPGHAQVRVLNLEESIKFYTDVMGMVETGRDDQGRVYFKCWDERDHNSYIIREAETPGIDFFAFKVLDAATLDQLDKDLNDYGLSTERIPRASCLKRESAYVSPCHLAMILSFTGKRRQSETACH